MQMLGAFVARDEMGRPLVRIADTRPPPNPLNALFTYTVTATASPRMRVFAVNADGDAKRIARSLLRGLYFTILTFIGSAGIAMTIVSAIFAHLGLGSLGPVAIFPAALIIFPTTFFVFRLTQKSVETALADSEVLNSSAAQPSLSEQLAYTMGSMITIGLPFLGGALLGVSLFSAYTTSLPGALGQLAAAWLGMAAMFATMLVVITVLDAPSLPGPKPS